VIDLPKLEPIAYDRLPLITPVDCPLCGAPVFIPSDSDRERVTCVDMDCGAELVTRLLIDGVALDQLAEVE
jgi:hypothetical protein